MDEVEEGKGIVLHCHHSFCKDCTVGYLEDKIKDAKVLDIPCISPDCSSFFQYSVLQSVLPAELFAKYEEFTLLAALKVFTQC